MIGRFWLAILIVLACATGTFAQNGQDRYAVIEVGSSGVKVRAYEISPAQAAEMTTDANAGAGLRYALFNDHGLAEPAELNVNPYRAENVERTADAVKSFVDALYEDYAVPLDNIYVVGASGVSSVDHADELAVAITQHAGRSIEFITPDREAALNFDWVTPNYRRSTALVIDLGSSNVHASYLRASRGLVDAHEAFEVLPLGTKSLLDAIVEQVGGKRPDDLRLRFAAMRSNAIEPAIYRVSTNQPGLVNRQRVYLLGGIVWALVAHERPEEHNADWVQLHRADFISFRDRVRSGRAFDQYSEKLAAIPNPALREAAAREIARVADVFTEDQLLAGVEIMLAFENMLDLEGREAVFFSRIGRDGWRSQYLIEKIAALDQEQES